MWFSTGATQALIPDPNYQYYVKDLNKVSVCGSLLERHRPSYPTQTTNTMSRISLRSVKYFYLLCGYTSKTLELIFKTNQVFLCRL